MAATRIALIGIGKIARDQHVPTIAAADGGQRGLQPGQRPQGEPDLDQEAAE